MNLDEVTPEVDEGRITCARTPEYYRWRCSKPDNSYVVYRVGRPNSPAVFVSVSDESISHDPSDESVRILDVVPNHDSTADQERQVLTIIAEICSTHRDSPKITGPAILAEYLSFPRLSNFLSTDEFPLSAVASPTPVIARPFGEPTPENWHVDGFDLRDASNWNVDLVERDLY